MKNNENNEKKYDSNNEIMIMMKKWIQMKWNEMK